MQKQLHDIKAIVPVSPMQSRPPIVVLCVQVELTNDAVDERGHAGRTTVYDRQDQWCVPSGGACIDVSPSIYQESERRAVVAIAADPVYASPSQETSQPLLGPKREQPCDGGIMALGSKEHERRTAVYWHAIYLVHLDLRIQSPSVLRHQPADGRHVPIPSSAVDGLHGTPQRHACVWVWSALVCAWVVA